LSDTPRTSAKVGELMPLDMEFRAMGICVLAMQLERELAAARAELAKFEPDLFWDADNPEDIGCETLDDLVHRIADDMGIGDGVREIDVTTACRMPSIKVRAWVENDELMWERIDEAKEPTDG